MANTKERSENKIDVTLECGAKLHINRANLDNIELMDELVAVDEGDPTAVSRILRLILTEEDRKALYDAVREDGRVPTSKIIVALKDMFDKIGEQGKN